MAQRGSATVMVMTIDVEDSAPDGTGFLKSDFYRAELQDLNWRDRQVRA